MDIMLDLETLSSAPDAVIVSIGAVTFSTSGRPNEIDHRFYTAEKPDYQQNAGAEISGATVQWWAQQSDAARAVLNDAGAVYLAVALDEFRKFCAACGERPRVWGNGANFDNVVLRRAYERMMVPAPWEFRDDRCYRTLKNLRTDIAFEKFGVAHNALDDAIAQAQHAERIFAAMTAERAAIVAEARP